jgi:hypothetical protein
MDELDWCENLAVSWVVLLLLWPGAAAAKDWIAASPDWLRAVPFEDENGGLGKGVVAAERLLGVEPRTSARGM